jgi:hypothetical protein
MKKRETRTLAIALAVYLLAAVLTELTAPQGHAAGRCCPSFAAGHGLAPAGQNPNWAGSPTRGRRPRDWAGSAESKPADEDVYLRAFAWTAADKKSKQVAFALAKRDVKSELSQFGIPRGMENTLIYQKKGFQRLAVYRGSEIYMVNYTEIFLRSLPLFPGLTKVLQEALEPQPRENLLLEFFFFVQAIRYKKPPFYYGNKFINSYFPPLICLYEQYGDCDSKSVLLAVLLTCHNKKEKTALALINSQGLRHSILLVKRVPQPGMSALFITGKGYYIPLETSAPGWAPGFVDPRVWNAMRSGEFRFHELQ